MNEEDKDFFETVVEQDQANAITNGIKDGFQSKVKAARDLLEKKGEWTGLCVACLGTNYSFMEVDGYQMLEYTQEDKDSPIKLIKCTHGRDISADYNY